MHHSVIVSPLLLGLFLTSCREPESAATPPPPPTAEFVHPVQKEITSWDYYNGRLEAVESVEVRARVSGMLEQIHFDAGAKVNKGDLLYTIDKAPFLAAHRAAEAELEQAEASAALAESNYTRGQKLLERNAIAKEEVDVREGTLAQAKARVQAARAQLETTALNLSYTEVRSPISGRIADHFITVGNLISGGTAQSTLLTTIVSIDPIYVRIDADESSVLKYLRLEQEGKRESARNTSVPVEMALDGDEGFPRKGHIDFVNNSFDSGTATLRARAVFPNEDGFLTPGMFAKVRLPGRGEYTATLIPEVALQTQQNLTLISTLDEENIVRSEVVTLGPVHGDMRVIESELPLGTRVIVSGLTRVRPGAPATPKPAEQ
ncbi:MAG: efflux RND transporter periplasmic adaptor subunit [Verrucomicrobiota bacterium JB023]|nr:efflux RND transporter periplasmic adaptor subunit [Verrucomicrobiota bacterium JB023]